jgi:hypothetical protein
MLLFTYKNNSLDEETNFPKDEDTNTSEYEETNYTKD